MPPKKAEAATRSVSRAAIYIRLSKDRQGSVSMVKQREECEAKLEKLGKRYVYDAADYKAEGDHYADNDRSAYQDGPRPAFEELKRRIEAGEYDGGVVVFYKLDRLIRRLRAWTEIEKLAEDHRVRLVSAMEPLDTSEKGSRLLASLLANFAQLEAETIGERVRGSQRVLARDGRYSGGKKPYGYQRIDHPSGKGFALAPHPTEAEVMRRAAKMVLKQRPLNEVSRQLNAAGFTNRNGGPLRGSNVGKWLRNPALIGKSDLSDPLGEGGKRSDSAIVEPVLTEREWRKVQAVLARNTPLSAGRQRNNDILLSGLVRCATCGHKMRGVVKAYGTYSCFAGSDGSGECATPSHISRDALDEFVIEWFLHRLVANSDGGPDRQFQAARAALDARLAELDKQRSRAALTLQNLDDEYFGGEHDNDETAKRQLKARRKQYRDKLAEVEAELDELTLRSDRLATRDVSPVEREDWDSLDIFERRRMLADFIDCVIVARPTNGQKSGPKADFSNGRVVIRTTVEALNELEA